MLFEMKFLITLISLISFISESSADIPSLPYCPETDLGLLIVSTLDGKISALNSSGSKIWEIDTGPGPLLLSNIHNLELTNNGEWIRIIPSLAGTLYKFDGSTIDPIPITTEELLKSSYKYLEDLVIAGGIEVRTYGVGFHSGTFYYECNSQKCTTNSEDTDSDDILVIERSTHTIRAVEPRTGHERWNFSVGLHDIKLSKISCININSKLFEWNVSAILPEGELQVTVMHNNVEESWNYAFTSPIVRVWRWSGKNLSEVNLFAPRHTSQIVTQNSLLPSIYLGMHKKQLYIHESAMMQNAIRAKSTTSLTVVESGSIAKIPWKPIPASTANNEEDSTALSVLNASEYVNGQGFYLFTESDLQGKDRQLCDGNDTKINKNSTKHSREPIKSLYYLLIAHYWMELFLMIITLFISYFLFRKIQQKHQKEIIIIEKPIAVPTYTNERRTSEREGEFTSRYVEEYDTLRCLGKGGFGVVFEVKHKVDECSYAIKRITLPTENKDKDRVMREVKALAKLEHQNIVRYFCSWVESPPVSWQQEYDRRWLGDALNHDLTFTTTTESKGRRGKSVSISIEDHAQRHFDLEKCNTGLETDDDSFIVFEQDSKDPKNSSVVSDSSDQKANYTSQDNSAHNVKNTSYAEHLRKKIDWKRPDRKHHSWDISQNNLITLDADPPVFLYIQMQLCKKESLKEWLINNRNRNYFFILDTFSQILEAVEYVHLRGLIHRDLKPSNIFFSLDGQVKVGDFGLVKDVEDAYELELYKKGSAPSYRGHTKEVGTTLYMSPEQFKSRIYDYKVDIYSLGLIFFEMLVPFSTEMERIKMLTDVKKNIYPSDFEQKFPNEHKLLQNMLCKDPNKRLTTIGIKARSPFNREDSGVHYCLRCYEQIQRTSSSLMANIEYFREDEDSGYSKTSWKISKKESSHVLNFIRTYLVNIEL